MKIINSILIVLFCAHIQAQPSLEPYLNSVRINNELLAVAREYREFQLLSARTGILPPDPGIEYGRMWSDPIQGNRTDLSIMQHLDFPTVYIDRAKLSGLHADKANFILDQEEETLLLKAKQKWLEAVFLNKKKKLLEERYRDAQEVQRIMELRFNSGEINILQLNKAKIMVASLNTKLELLQSEIINTGLELGHINGDIDFPVMDSLYPAVNELYLDSIFGKFESGPQFSLLDAESAIKSSNKRLAVSNKLPKLMAGYYSEQVPAVNMRGVKVGVSIPLWQHANTIKQAKSEILYTELNNQHFINEEKIHIEQKYRTWQSMKEQLAELTRLTAEVNDVQLLQKMIQAGEITSTEYYLEVEAYLQVLMNQLTIEKELHLIQAELLKYEL